MSAAMNDQTSDSTPRTPTATPEDLDSGFEQPLREPPDIEEPEPPRDPASVHGSATIATQLMSVGLTVRFGMPLDEQEASEFHRDLAAVLCKYDVPDMPYAEECQLMATTGGIIIRRVQARKAIEAKPVTGEEKKDLAHDHVVHRQEGKRENRTPPQTGMASGTSEASSLLA